MNYYVLYSLKYKKWNKEENVGWSWLKNMYIQREFLRLSWQFHAFKNRAYIERVTAAVENQI